MSCRLSVIIPNRNGEKTIGLCLEALYRSDHDAFEVIVVDDCSTDNSLSVIERFPCEVVKLKQHAGAAKARNIGAMHSCGDVLFFTDADCLVLKDTLTRVENLASSYGEKTVIGGTYTPRPYDQSFYSTFQSAFIHYCELKKHLQPDYIAAHAMIIFSQAFTQAGGFPDDFLPIIEDVEFSHRLRKQGFTLVMAPELQVRHIFNFRCLGDSLRNGYRKSKYWTIYSLGNKDILSDSGTASLELKVNVLSFFGSLALAAGYIVYSSTLYLLLLIALVCVNIFTNLKLFSLFYRVETKFFFWMASLYYMFIYPIAVATGALTGLVRYVLVRVSNYTEA